MNDEIIYDDAYSHLGSLFSLDFRLAGTLK